VLPSKRMLAFATAPAWTIACPVKRQWETVMSRLDLQRPPLAMGGGMLNGPLRDATVKAIRPGIASATYVSDPPLGAVVLARRLLVAPPAAS